MKIVAIILLVLFTGCSTSSSYSDRHDELKSMGYSGRHDEILKSMGYGSDINSEKVIIIR